MSKFIKSEKKTFNENENQNTLIVNTEYSEINNLFVNNNSNFNNLSINSNLNLNGNANIKMKNYNISEDLINQKIHNPFVPCGTILSFATKKAPDGWLACDGSYVLIDDYKNLSDVIGNIWDNSQDNDITKFRLPNLNSAGYFIQGGNVDGQYYIDSTSKPKNNFTITIDGNTTEYDGQHTHGLYTKDGGGTAIGHEEVKGNLPFFPSHKAGLHSGGKQRMYGIDPAGDHDHTFSATINSTNISDWDNETAPKNVKFLYCIKY